MEDEKKIIENPPVSLRDYLAANVDVSVYTPIDAWRKCYSYLARPPNTGELANYISVIRYIEADAMLAERAEDN